jgi:hypothetical protein
VWPKQFGKNRYISRRPKKSNQDFIVIIHHPATPLENYTPLHVARGQVSDLPSANPDRRIDELLTNKEVFSGCRRPSLASSLTVKNQNQKAILIPTRRSLNSRQTINIGRIIGSIPLSTPVDLQTPAARRGFALAESGFSMQTAPLQNAA